MEISMKLKGRFCCESPLCEWHEADEALDAEFSGLANRREEDFVEGFVVFKNCPRLNDLIDIGVETIEETENFIFFKWMEK